MDGAFSITFCSSSASFIYSVQCGISNVLNVTGQLRTHQKRVCRPIQQVHMYLPFFGWCRNVEQNITHMEGLLLNWFNHTFTWPEWLPAVSAISNQHQHLKHTKYEGTCSICLRVKSHLQIFPGRMFKDDGEIFPWVVSLPPSWKKYCPEGNVFISADSVPAHLLWLFVLLFHLWYLPSGCQAPQQLSRHIIQSHLYRGVVLRKPEVRQKQALNSYFVKGRGTTADNLMACSFPHSHCCSGVVYVIRRYTSYTY